MKRSFYILVILLCFSIHSYSQFDSLKSEILSYEDTTAVTIKKGRKLLLESFQKNDRSKVQQIITYLTKQVENEDYLALYPIEQEMINYWLGQYNEVDSEVQKYTDFYLTKNEKKLRPQTDLLFEKIKAYMKDHEKEQISQIERSKLSEEQKSFLKINLTFLSSDYKRSAPLQDTLNDLTSDFIAKYPHSKYETYLREQIRWAFKPSKWGYGFEFFTGYGVFTKTLSQQFQNSIPIGVAFEFMYKKYALYLRDYIGFSHIKEDLPFQAATWSKGKQARVYLPELSVGYVCTKSDKLKVIPFVGISSTDITPTSKDQSDYQGYSDIGWTFTTTYTVGLNVDIRISKVNTLLVRRQRIEKSYSFLKVRYAYNAPQFQNKYAGLNGDMHYLTIGFGIFGRMYNRD